MDNLQKHAFFVALNDLAKAAHQLNKVWTEADLSDEENILSELYPFQLSFDELCLAIDKWKENITNRLFTPNAPEGNQPIEDAHEEYTELEGIKVRVIADKQNPASHLLIAPVTAINQLADYDSRIAYYAKADEINLPEDQLYQLIKIADRSLYERWNDNEIGNFGSFQTLIFEAYRQADSNNRNILEVAYPHWFISPKLYISRGGAIHEPTRNKIVEAIGDAEFETTNITSEVIAFIENIK
jgi:hypothetical protein